MITFILDGETPSKKNSRINTRSGRSFPSKRYTEWHNNALAQIYVQGKEQLSGCPIGSPCRISLTFTHEDLRRRDSDNGTSSILDLLKDSGVLEDDNWQIVREVNVDNLYCKGKACCEIAIELL